MSTAAAFRATLLWGVTASRNPRPHATIDPTQRSCSTTPTGGCISEAIDPRLAADEFEKGNTFAAACSHPNLGSGRGQRPSCISGCPCIHRGRRNQGTIVRTHWPSIAA